MRPPRHRGRFAVALMPLILALPAAAQAVDPAQCARIDDVRVPDAVAIADDRIAFGEGDARVEVMRNAVIVDGAVHGHDDPAYYDDLRRFLDAAAQSRGINPLAALLRGRGGELAQTATRMCAAVLALAESAARIERTLPGFTSPVRIRLK